jgi:hypothetical protein
MQKHSTNNTASRLGMSLSLICAIHCLAMPFVISFLPYASTFIGHHEFAESSMLGMSLLLAGHIFRKDFKRIHRRYLPGIILTLGFAASFFGTFVHESHIITALAGIMIFSAYLINWRLNSAFQYCPNPNHRH